MKFPDEIGGGTVDAPTTTTVETPITIGGVTITMADVVDAAGCGERRL